MSHQSGLRLSDPDDVNAIRVRNDGRILTVSGARLKKWIENRRHEWNARPAFPATSHARRLGTLHLQ
jgi:hypothetical protein